MCGEKCEGKGRGKVCGGRGVRGKGDEKWYIWGGRSVRWKNMRGVREERCEGERCEGREV